MSSLSGNIVHIHLNWKFHYIFFQINTRLDLNQGISRFYDGNIDLNTCIKFYVASKTLMRKKLVHVLFNCREI